MKIAFISSGGDTYWLALHASERGHQCHIFLTKAESGYRRLGTGRENPKVHVGVGDFNPRGFDLVVFDMVGNSRLTEAVVARGVPYIGANRLADKIELDRAAGMTFAKLSDVKVPEFKEFKSVNEALKFVEKEEELYVVKPLGNQDVSWTFVPKTKEALISFLQHFPGKPPLVLQKKVEGIEVSTEGWFDGQDWICFNHTIEAKRLHVGDVGPNTGCMWCVVWNTKKLEPDKLCEKIFTPKLTEALRKVGYVGPLDANCIVADKDVYFLEWTARFGYDALQAFSELLQVPLEDFLYNIATQAQPRSTLKVWNDMSMAVRLVMHPYPVEEKVFEHLKGLRVVKYSEQARKHMHLSDVMWKDKEPVLAGIDGVVGCITARGKDTRECWRRVLRSLEDVVLNQDVVYRTDAGLGVMEKIEKLETLGWVTTDFNGRRSNATNQS